MTWLPIDGAGTTDDVFALAPDIYEHYRELNQRLWRDGQLDPAVLELCRLRMAQLIGSTAELDVRHDVAAEIAQAQLENLRQWPTSPAFGPRERAALAFAEKYVIDAHSITDEDCAELNLHFTPAELTTLTTGLAMFDAMARFRVALGCAAPPPGPSPTTADAPLP